MSLAGVVAGAFLCFCARASFLSIWLDWGYLKNDTLVFERGSTSLRITLSNVSTHTIIFTDGWHMWRTKPSPIPYDKKMGIGIENTTRNHKQAVNMWQNLMTVHLTKYRVVSTPPDERGELHSMCRWSTLRCHRNIETCGMKVCEGLRDNELFPYGHSYAHWAQHQRDTTLGLGPTNYLFTGNGAFGDKKISVHHLHSTLEYSFSAGVWFAFPNSSRPLAWQGKTFVLSFVRNPSPADTHCYIIGIVGAAEYWTTGPLSSPPTGNLTEVLLVRNVWYGSLQVIVNGEEVKELRHMDDPETLGDLFTAIPDAAFDTVVRVWAQDEAFSVAEVVNTTRNESRDARAVHWHWLKEYMPRKLHVFGRNSLYSFETMWFASSLRYYQTWSDFSMVLEVIEKVSNHTDMLLYDPGVQIGNSLSSRADYFIVRLSEGRIVLMFQGGGWHTAKFATNGELNIGLSRKRGTHKPTVFCNGMHFDLISHSEDVGKLITIVEAAIKSNPKTLLKGRVGSTTYNDTSSNDAVLLHKTRLVVPKAIPSSKPAIAPTTSSLPPPSPLTPRNVLWLLLASCVLSALGGAGLLYCFWVLRGGPTAHSMKYSVKDV